MMIENRYDFTNVKSLIANTLREKDDAYLVNELFTRFTFNELLNVTEQELMQIKGIGPIKAKQIVSALNLVRIVPITTSHPYSIRSPKDAFEYLKDMQFLSQEHFVVIGLNTKNRVVFKDTIFVGSLNSSIIHPREVFKSLIKRSCSAGIVAHNHPSGDPTPSREDINVTERLKEAGKLLGIEILDHIIVGHNTFHSVKEKGLL